MMIIVVLYSKRTNGKTFKYEKDEEVKKILFFIKNKFEFRNLKAFTHLKNQNDDTSLITADVCETESLYFQLLAKLLYVLKLAIAVYVTCLMHHRIDTLYVCIARSVGNFM